MQIERITYPTGKRIGEGGRLVATGEDVTYLALCDDLFAVHPGGRDDDTDEQLFTITHRPTGYLMTAVVWDFALEILREIRRRGVERWQFTDPAYAKELSAEWRDIRAAAQKNVGGIWVGEPPPAAAAVDPVATSQQPTSTRDSGF